MSNTETVMSIMAKTPAIPRGADKGFMHLMNNLKGPGKNGKGSKGSGGPSGGPPGGGGGDGGEDQDAVVDPDDHENDDQESEDGQIDLAELAVDTLDELKELKSRYEDLTLMSRKNLRLAEMAKHSKPSIKRAVGRNSIVF